LQQDGADVHLGIDAVVSFLDRNGSEFLSEDLVSPVDIGREFGLDSRQHVADANLDLLPVGDGARS